MSCVFHGLTLIFASHFLPQSILINDDLPTLLLPMKTNSSRSAGGHCCRFGAEVTNVADLICMGSVWVKIMFFLKGHPLAVPYI
jgi:hypothetical protein